MTGKVCDFCSAPNVAWAFRCEDFRADVLGLTADGSRAVRVPWGSHGGWAACPACKELVIRKDWKRLARRSAKRMVRNHPNVSLGLALKIVTSLHTAFLAHDGARFPPIPTTPTEPDMT